VKNKRCFGVGALKIYYFRAKKIWVQFLGVKSR